MPSDQRLAARDRALPGLATVLDADAAAALVARLLPDAPSGAPQLTYTRYKPGASCLVALRYDDAGSAAFVTLKAVSLTATDKWAKYQHSEGATVDETRRIVMRRFPNDGELRGPRWLFDPARAAEVRTTLALPLDATFDVIAYKPERRLVARASVDGVPVAVIKCHDRGAFTHALAAQRALAVVADLPVNTASAWVERRGVLAAPWTAGRLLDIATDTDTHVAAAGAALARIHDAPLDIRAGDTDEATELVLHKVAQTVAGWLPAAQEPLRHLLARLTRHRQTTAPIHTAIHGDFYAKQVLVTDGGISLLDFDECVVSDPHIDLANFAAHLELDVLRQTCSRARADAVMHALLSGYTQTRVIDRQRLAWRTAEALIRLTPHPFRHRDPEWPVLTHRLVGAAQALLDRIVVRTTPRSTLRVPPVPPVVRRGWERLQADDALAFAAPLAAPEIATRALESRLFSPTLAAVSVQHTSVVRHKPGRRCMIEIDLVHDGANERWLGKIRARGLDSRAALIHRMLWDGGAAPIIAEPLGSVDTMQMTLQRAIDGMPLLQRLADDDSPATLGLRVADSIATLHELSCDPGRRWTLDAERELLHTRLSALATSHPAHRPAIDSIRRALPSIISPLSERDDVALIHRDVYHDQVLVTDTHCRLIDLDLCTHGDPAIDIGNLIAHLIELQWRSGVAALRVQSFAEACCSALLARPATKLTESAIVRYALLTLARLMEIASRMPERSAYLPRHLERLRDMLPTATLRPTLPVLLAAMR